ncbi:ketopantoate reductase family protein [Streptosporangium sandarakinum]
MLAHRGLGAGQVAGDGTQASRLADRHEHTQVVEGHRHAGHGSPLPYPSSDWGIHKQPRGLTCLSFLAQDHCGPRAATLSRLPCRVRTRLGRRDGCRPTELRGTHRAPSRIRRQRRRLSTVPCDGGRAAALHRIPAHHLDGGLLLPLLNGVEHVAALRDRYGAQRVVPAVIRVESTRSAPGVIEHGSPFTEIDLAGPRDRLAELAALLTSAGAETRVLADESTVLWAKLAFLAPFALLTTRYQLPIGDIRTERREELAALVEETAAVGRAYGAQTDATQILARYDAFPAGSRSSMQRDAKAGRPLELDAIGGALLRAAERHGIRVPHVALLVRELTC